MSEQKTWQLFWAKTDRENPDSDWTRPLWAHLLDVAHTALLLWERFVPDSFRARLAGDLGLPEKETGYLLSWWIGLHDIGKAIPTFQALHEPSQKRLEQDGGLSFRFTKRRHHGYASIAILYQWLQRQQHPYASFFEHVAAFVGFHHGRLYPQDGWRDDETNVSILGDEAWNEARFALLEAVQHAWFQRYPVDGQPAFTDEQRPSWLLGFAGWATLADWLGSMAECFPTEVGHDLNLYLNASRTGAEEALRKAGFGSYAALRFPGFEQLFPPFSPNELQKSLIALDLPDGGVPTLTIVEAPTGEGKTEAAYALAARQQSRHAQGGGLYVAMPTQATSNGLFKRTLDFLNKAHDEGRGGPWANFRLVHGNADLHEEQEKLIAGQHNEQEKLISDLDALETQFDDDGQGDGESEQRVRTLRWFLKRKRSLIAPYGLGTVDQALLGVLYARHFFLRLFGLTGKTVIFDEVHAYDLYMGRLFGRLLAWLHALGTHVILLSATLPAKLREQCFKAWQAQPEHALPPPIQIPYPAVWSAHNGTYRLEAGNFPTSWSQQARLIRHAPEPEAIAASVCAAVLDGATVGVICNTVRRAQAVYQAVRDGLGGQVDTVLLFHARYLFRERNRREKAALDGFSKKRADGKGAVLIATQVAEQSLDLDFDVLFTDLAPIDLLLQRAGRLHRHLKLRPSALRPAGYGQPTVYWLCPDTGDHTLPDLSGLGIRASRFSVYELLIVWKTWLLLHGRNAWHLPEDYRLLIEQVYDDGDSVPDGLDEAAQQAWQAAVECFCDNEHQAKRAAKAQMIEKPTTQGMEDLLTRNREELADSDDEDAHPVRRALTRQGTDSVEVVVLYESEQGRLFLDADLKIPAPLNVPPGRKDVPVEAVKQLLGNSARLGYEQIAEALRSRSDDEVPARWRQAAEHTAALLYRHPLLLRNRTCTVAGYRIEDDDELGLCITRV